MIKTLLNAGFRGNIFPVNPSYQKVLGLKLYSSLKDISEKIDLVFLILNRRAVPDMMRTCADKGIKAVVVVADGFAERDEEGARLQHEIAEIAKKSRLASSAPIRLGWPIPPMALFRIPMKWDIERSRQGELPSVPKLE